MVIALAIMAGVISLLFLIYGYRDIDRANNWAKLFQALFTITAFGLAAYWYFAERKGMPHADVSQEIILTRVGRGVVSIETHVRIKNLGERLLRINRIYSRLQEIQGESYNYADLADLENDAYWNAVRPSGSGAQFNRAELRWPVARQFDDTVEHEIEPGESDLFVATFLVPCSDVRDFRVATDVYKPGGDPDHPLAWKARSFGNVAEICEQEQSEQESQGTSNSERRVVT